MRSNLAVILVFFIAPAFSLHAWAKCPTLTAEVRGRVQCSFKSDYKVLLTLIFKKNQPEASAEETALDIQGDSFQGRIGRRSSRGRGSPVCHELALCNIVCACASGPGCIVCADPPKGKKPKSMSTAS